MKIAIMQPYFFPYIGYFQLIKSVDRFIVYDNIKYTKKGWINRNRMLQNGKDVTFSVPLKKGSDSLNICQREMADNFNRIKLLNRITGTYHNAPYFESTFPLIESILQYDETNLFEFIHNSLVCTCKYLGIDTDICISSTVNIDHTLKGTDKVLALCTSFDAHTYINPIGGLELYSKESFREQGIKLNFIKSKPFEYEQFGQEFVPWLSIIDVLMFNLNDKIKKDLLEYELI